MSTPENIGEGQMELDVSALLLAVSSDTKKTVYNVLEHADINILLQIYRDSRKGSETEESSIMHIKQIAGTDQEWTDVANALLGKMLLAGTPTKSEIETYTMAVTFMISESDSLETLMKKTSLIKNVVFNTQSYKIVQEAKDKIEDLIELRITVPGLQLPEDTIQRLLKIFAGSKRFQVREYLKTLTTAA